MSSVITENNLFRPTRSKAETKAKVTDRAARTIIEAEAERRGVKTARLRQARLEMEAAQAARVTSVKPRHTGAATSRRARSSV
jgi:hypothetical protein